MDHFNNFVNLSIPRRTLTTNTVTAATTTSAIKTTTVSAIAAQTTTTTTTAISPSSKNNNISSTSATSLNNNLNKIRPAKLPENIQNSKFHENVKLQRSISTSMDLAAPTTTVYNNHKNFPSTSDISSSFSYSSDNTTQSDQKNNNSSEIIQNGNRMLSPNQSWIGLDEYYDTNLNINHQKQSSYAQSEGYHSYVSSADSTSTSFLDRLRKESQQLQSRINSWSQEFQVAENINNNSIASVDNKSSDSDTSSTKTLKWIDSIIDSNNSAVSAQTNLASTQLIARSSKVPSPQKYNPEKFEKQQSHSELSSNRSNSRLFHINTYTEVPPPTLLSSSTMNLPTTSVDLKLQSNQNWQSVAERINELEKQQQTQQNFQQHQQQQQQFLMQAKNINSNKPKYSYLDPSKQHRVPNPALKAFQKNAIQSYFERQTSAKLNSSNSSDRSSLNSSIEENELSKRKNLYTNEQKFNGNQLIAKTTSNESINRINSNLKLDDIPPNPPPRKPILRRTSSVSEYSSFRDKVLQSKQHLSKDLLQPMIMGPIISVDDWEAPQKIPERPPKNPMLRAVVCKSPDLPPPPPIDNVDLNNLENLPLPSPPPELQQPPVKQVPEPDKITNRRNSFAGHGNNGFLFRTSTLENLMASQLPLRAHNISPGLSDVPPPINQRHSLGVIGNTPHPHPHPMDIKFNKNNLNDRIANNQNQQFKFTKMESPRKMFVDRVPDPRSTDIRLSIRKRAHNSKDIIISHHQNGRNVNLGNRNANNSKTSYLPSQTRDAFLSNSDQGSYKMTSNELNINPKSDSTIKNSCPNDTIIPQKCNLPDVLPVGVKLFNHHHQSQQQLQLQTQTSDYHSMEHLSCPQTAPVLQNPTKNVFQFQSSTNSPSIQASFTSQSVFDLNTGPQLLKYDEVLDKNVSSPNLYETPLNSQNVECDKIAMVRKITMVEDSLSVTDIEAKTPELSETSPLMESSLTIDKLDMPLEESLQLVTLRNSPIHNDIDESKLTQRTEIILRVQPSTQEVASQTESDCKNAENELKVDYWNPLARKKLQEEYDCEKLSKDLAFLLSPSDKLHEILVPKILKTSSDYISDLFKVNVTSMPTTHEKLISKCSLDVPANDGAYIQTDAKSKIRYNRELALIQGESCNLTKKKEQLVQSMSKKLKLLANEQTMLTEEQTANDILGNEVSMTVAHKVRPIDSTKYRSYVDDVGHITMLLLSLSGRLAKTENTLSNSNLMKSEDKKLLESKRDKLLEQLEEAKHLKQDIDRRGKIISNILEKALTIEEFADYNYFINMKAKLIVDSREIAEKIKLGEEQLTALKQSVFQSEC